jgi:hypothetical protein
VQSREFLAGLGCRRWPGAKTHPVPENDGLRADDRYRISVIITTLEQNDFSSNRHFALSNCFDAVPAAKVLTLLLEPL